MINTIITEINLENGRLYKEAVLEKHKDNALFKNILELTYSPLIKFGIKEIPVFSYNGQNLSLEWAVNALSVLTLREKTGYAGKEHLSNILSSLSPENALIVIAIIQRDLKINCGTTTINKIFGKNFIKDTPYQGAIPFDNEKVEQLFNIYDAVFSQVKMDGRYTNVLIHKTVELESRQGLPTYFQSRFTPLLAIKEQLSKEVVLNGELVIKGLSRYVSNGIIASLAVLGEKFNLDNLNDIFKDPVLSKEFKTETDKFYKKHQVSYQHYLEKITLVVWDIIPYQNYLTGEHYPVSYKDRFNQLTAIVNQLGVDDTEFPLIALCESKQVNNKKEAFEHYQHCLLSGEEGTILKGNSFWQDGKHNHQIKFKNEILLDLKITGFQYGEQGKKNEKVISSIVCQSEDGLLTTKLTNMKKDVMVYVTENQENLLNTVVVGKCNGVSFDKNGDYSCLHPCVHGGEDAFRTDKTVANTLPECIAIDMASKEISQGLTEIFNERVKSILLEMQKKENISHIKKIHI
jgi:hypothetical protein